MDVEGLFRQLIELAPDAVWINERGRLVFANPATAHMLGYDDPAEVLALTPGEFVHPDDRQAMQERSLKMITSGQSMPPREYRVKHRDGRWLMTEVHSMPISWQGRPAILGFARDITGRKEMEARLVRADRLAALGTLLAGIAHEMNNPLSYVLLGVDEVSDNLEQLPPAKLRNLLGEIRHGVHRLASIVRQLRATSRPESEERGPTDLRAVVEGAARVAHHQIRHRAELRLHCDAVAPVEANAQRLEQVVLNLLVNASQALPEGRADNQIEVRLASAGEQVVLEVRDNGQGIPSEVLPRIFDPFFTTKPVGLGMGLGLSICHGIVAGHGGSITAESDGPGRGACFRVSLPTMKAPRPPLPSRTPTPALLPATMAELGQLPRLLVVDDEPALGEMIGRMLRADFQVEVMVDARDAFERLAGDRHYDVVLCDLMMPVMTGMDLFDAIARQRPALTGNFVFMTGGAFTERAAEFLARVPNQCIDKPFSRAALKALLAAR